MLVRNDLQARQVDLDSPLEAVGVELAIKISRVRFIRIYAHGDRVEGTFCRT